jgi:hypothetical protein
VARAVLWCDERVIKWEVLARVVESERSYYCHCGEAEGNCL